MRGKRISAVAHGGLDITKVRPDPEFRALRVSWTRRGDARGRHKAGVG
jgi:hypothetical protein